MQKTPGKKGALGQEMVGIFRILGLGYQLICERSERLLACGDLAAAFPFHSIFLL
jgi:hypothetical protein